MVKEIREDDKRILDFRPETKVLRPTQATLLEEANKMIPKEFIFVEDAFGISLYARHAKTLKAKTELKRIEIAQEGNWKQKLAYLKGYTDAYKLELASDVIQKDIANIIAGQKDIGKLERTLTIKKKV